MKWIFSVVLWDETGNVLLERKTRTIDRVCRFIAKEYVQKEFPTPYFVELESSKP